MNAPINREHAAIQALMQEQDRIEINDSEAAYSSAVRLGATCNELARRRNRINTLCTNYALRYGTPLVLRNGVWV